MLISFSPLMLIAGLILDVSFHSFRQAFSEIELMAAASSIDYFDIDTMSRVFDISFSRHWPLFISLASFHDYARFSPLLFRCHISLLRLIH
jgi:beta-galactosidase GanA